MIYFDNAATTFPKPEKVYQAMDFMSRNGAVNAGRGSYRLAKEASNLIMDTKNQLRKLVNVDNTTNVVFCPSITIAMNQIINGITLVDESYIYVSPYEHNAVARSLKHLSTKKRIILKVIPLKDGGLEIDIEKLIYEFATNKPSAVFCTHVSNVTGYILPIEQIFSEAKKYGAITVLDAAQSLGLIEVNSKNLNADIIAFTGHKTLYGPIGIGGFINVSNIDLEIFISGGTGTDSLNLDMPKNGENKFEAASMNIVAIAGLNAALKELIPAECLKKEKELTNYLVCQLKKITGIQLYVPEKEVDRTGIVSFTVDGMKSEDLGLILDEDFDIAVRTGYHCAPFIHKYLNDMDSLGTIRIGLSQYNTIQEIDTFIGAIKEVLYD